MRVIEPDVLAVRNHVRGLRRDVAVWEPGPCPVAEPVAVPVRVRVRVASRWPGVALAVALLALGGALLVMPDDAGVPVPVPVENTFP